MCHLTNKILKFNQSLQHLQEQVHSIRERFEVEKRTKHLEILKLWISRSKTMAKDGKTLSQMEMLLETETNQDPEQLC